MRFVFADAAAVNNTARRIHMICPASTPRLFPIPINNLLPIKMVSVMIIPKPEYPLCPAGRNNRSLRRDKQRQLPEHGPTAVSCFKKSIFTSPPYHVMDMSDMSLIHAII